MKCENITIILNLKYEVVDEKLKYNGAYVYVAPFENGKILKIGRSSKNLKRVNKLNKLYDLALCRTLIFWGEYEKICEIERELKEMIPECNHIYGKVDGATELREIKHLNIVVEYIRRKSLSFTIKEYTFYECSDFIERTSQIDLELMPFSCRGHDYMKSQKKKYKLDLYEYAILFSHLFKRYFFDIRGHLVLVFMNTDKNYLEKLCFNSAYHIYCENRNEIYFRLFNYGQSDSLLEYVCAKLYINPLLEERIKAIDNHQRKVEFYKQNALSNVSITFKDFINNEFVLIKPSLLFKDVVQIKCSKRGYCFSLIYRSKPNKKVFYRDSLEYHEWNGEAERNQEFVRLHKSESLLNDTFLVFKDEDTERYFWQCAKLKGVRLSMKRERNNYFF